MASFRFGARGDAHGRGRRVWPTDVSSGPIAGPDARGVVHGAGRRGGKGQWTLSKPNRLWLVRARGTRGHGTNPPGPSLIMLRTAQPVGRRTNGVEGTSCHLIEPRARAHGRTCRYHAHDPAMPGPTWGPPGIASTYRAQLSQWSDAQGLRNSGLCTYSSPVAFAQPRPLLNLGLCSPGGL